MKLTLDIAIGNDATTDCNGRPTLDRLAEMLKQTADKVRTGAADGTIRDYNGNTVGSFAIVSEPEDFDPSTVPVLFNMTLANGSTSARFCYEAASVLGLEIDEDDAAYLAYDHGDDIDRSEAKDEIVQEWTDKLDAAGYSVNWDAGDVRVYDLRNLSDDEREAFYDAQQ